MAFTVPRGSLSSLRLPFAIAQHLHPRESKRWLLPLMPLPAGRAGWGIRCDRPMKPTFLRPGSGQSQGGRSRTLRHTRSEAHTHSHRGARALAFTLAHAHPAQHGEGATRRGQALLTIDRLGCPPDQGRQRERSDTAIAGRSCFLQVLLHPKSTQFKSW